MTAVDEELVLQEYEDWKTNRLQEPVDQTTVAIFLFERRAEHNKRKIADATAKLFIYINNFEQRDPTKVDAVEVLDVLRDIDDILTVDRPYQITSTITGPIERTFT